MKQFFTVVMLLISCWNVHGQQEIKGQSKQRYVNIRNESVPVSNLSVSQDIKGQSNQRYVNIGSDQLPVAKEQPKPTITGIKPPFLTILPGSLQFNDANGNNFIDANEQASISFEVENSGLGDGNNLKAVITENLGAPGINYASVDLGVIPKATKRQVVIPMTGSLQTTNGMAEFTLYIDEPGGFGSDPVSMQVKTRAFVTPLLKITDYSVTSDNSSTLIRKRPFEVQVLLQNVDYGDAEEVQVNLNLPENIVLLSANENVTFPELKPGESKLLIYTLVVNDKYMAGTVPLWFSISERFGKYAENRTLDLTLDQHLSSEKLIVKTTDQGQAPAITIASISAETDKNIPVSPEKNMDRYALVIGNEDYSRFQPDLSSESNVDFARNDALIFSRYCENLLGVPKDNVFLLTDATGVKMKQNIDKLVKLARYSGGHAELIFYYAGHGFPDETTREGYLIPVDVTGSNVKEGISLASLYGQLTSSPVHRVTVILDACFSGSGRNMGLLAARGVKIKPKTETLAGNILVLSSTGSDQVSLPYKEKKHGMFTYYLLKKLQDTSAEITWSDLADYLRQQVPKQSIRVNNKEQVPEVSVSSAIETEWKTWRVK